MPATMVLAFHWTALAAPGCFCRGDRGLGRLGRWAGCLRAPAGSERLDGAKAADFAAPCRPRGFLHLSCLCPLKVLHPPGGMHTRPAWVGSTDVSTGAALGQRGQQCLRLLQVSGVKALGEPAVDRGEEVIGFLAFALLLPQAS